MGLTLSELDMSIKLQLVWELITLKPMHAKAVQTKGQGYHSQGNRLNKSFQV